MREKEQGPPQSESSTAFMPILLAKKKKTHSQHENPFQHPVLTSVKKMLLPSRQSICLRC